MTKEQRAVVAEQFKEDIEKNGIPGFNIQICEDFKEPFVTYKCTLRKGDKIKEMSGMFVSLKRGKKCTVSNECLKELTHDAFMKNRRKMINNVRNAAFTSGYILEV